MPDGPVARWRVIYDLLQPLRPGDVLTYERMARALELDAKADRHVIQMAARRALRELLDVDHRGAEAVTNTGYRVAAASDHLSLGEKRSARAGRQISAGHAVTTKVDLTGVDPSTAAAIQVMAHGFAVQGEMNRRLAAKDAEHDELINLLTKRVERLEGH
jgi:hypothetical protein